MKKTYHIFLVFTLFICLSACAQNKTNSKNNKINMTHTETITLGSGCFWCTEAIFQRLQGVVKVTSGYSGGFVDNPTYEQVCDKNTGHAEVCQIVYDTTLIKLDDIFMSKSPIYKNININKILLNLCYKIKSKNDENYKLLSTNIHIRCMINIRTLFKIYYKL